MWRGDDQARHGVRPVVPGRSLVAGRSNLCQVSEHDGGEGLMATVADTGRVWKLTSIQRLIDAVDHLPRTGTCDTPVQGSDGPERCGGCFHCVIDIVKDRAEALKVGR